MVSVFEDGKVKCEAIRGDLVECDPVALWRLRQHCGNCPLLAFADNFAFEKFSL